MGSGTRWAFMASRTTSGLPVALARVEMHRLAGGVNSRRRCARRCAHARSRRKSLSMARSSEVCTEGLLRLGLESR